jgi:5-methylcytosine-specific restriction endonuclease McrA
MYGVYGENHPSYIDGRTPENARIRSSPEYLSWRDQVFKRDEYTCQDCKALGVFLNAHHIKRFTDYPELRFDVSNGKTLCIECHNKYRKRIEERE